MFSILGIFQLLNLLRRVAEYEPSAYWPGQRKRLEALGWKQKWTRFLPTSLYVDMADSTGILNRVDSLEQCCGIKTAAIMVSLTLATPLQHKTKVPSSVPQLTSAHLDLEPYPRAPLN